MLFRTELNLKSQSLQGVQNKPLRHAPLISAASTTEYDAHQDLASMYADDGDIEGGASIKFTKVSSIGGMVRTKRNAIADPIAHEKLRQRQRCIFAVVLVVLMALAFYTFFIFNRAHGRPPPSGMYTDTTFLYFPPKPSAVPLPLPHAPVKGNTDGSALLADIPSTSSTGLNSNLSQDISQQVESSESQDTTTEDWQYTSDTEDVAESNTSFLETGISLVQTNPTLTVWHLSDLHIDPFYSPLDKHVQKGKRKVCRPPSGTKIYDPITQALVARVADRPDKVCQALERMNWQWTATSAGNSMPHTDWPLGRPFCDPPLETLHSSLDYIEEAQAKLVFNTPTVIVITGDIVGHKIKCPYVVSQVRSRVMREVKMRFPNAIILFVAGNNDYEIKDAPTSGNHFRLNRDIAQYLTLPEHFESSEALKTFRTTGAYTVDTPIPKPSADSTPTPNLRFIMFNSVLFSAGNVHGLSLDTPHDETDEAYGELRSRQFAFLEAELERARQDQVKVVLVAHAPPGAKAELLTQDEDMFYAVISPHVKEGRILVMLTGDLSRNEVRSIDTAASCSDLASDHPRDAEAPLTVLVSGGLSSRKGGAPSIRRLDFGMTQTSAPSVHDIALLDWTDFALEQPATHDTVAQWRPVFNFRSMARSHLAIAHPFAVRELTAQLYQVPPADVVFELAQAYGLFVSGGESALDSLQFDQERWQRLGEWVLARIQQEVSAAAWTPFSESRLVLSSRDIHDQRILKELVELSTSFMQAQNTASTRAVVIRALKLALGLDKHGLQDDVSGSRGDVAVASARRVFDGYVQNWYPPRLRCASHARSQQCHDDCKQATRSLRKANKIMKRGFEEVAGYLHQQSEILDVMMREEL